MKKVIFPALVILLAACSSENDDINSGNNLPKIGEHSFQIEEHTAPGNTIGIIEATDKDNDELTFTLQTHSNLNVDEITGEITLGEDIILDFESEPSIPFTVMVFDGEGISEKDFQLNLIDIDEYQKLTTSQKELVDYFVYLSLQKSSSSPSQRVRKWDKPMKIYLDGTISTTYKTTVEEIVEEYNNLFTNSDFTISLTNNISESNTHLFFGSKAELESFWPDVFEIVDNTNYSGLALTSRVSSNIVSSKIWISSETAPLTQHEIGHSLGLGHSELCVEKSFMCPTVNPQSTILPIEKKIISYLYNDAIPSGISEAEINFYLPNEILLTQE